MAEFILGKPLRGMARRHPLLRRTLWRLDYWLVAALLWLFRQVPVDAASRMGARVGRWLGPRLKDKHAIFRQNFRLAFPQLSEQEAEALARRAWGRAGRILGEYIHLNQFLRDEARLELDVRRPAAGPAIPAQPFVVVTAHHCSWEVIAAAMARRGMPNANLYTAPANPHLDRLLRRSRHSMNCTLVHRHEAARGLMQVMKAGGNIGMVIDRRVDGGKPVTFFGAPKPSTLLPAKLALKFGCEMVPCQVIRLRDARFRVIFHPPILPRLSDGNGDGNAEADEDVQALDMIQQVHAMFEDWIRAAPEDWFCPQRLWARDLAPPVIAPPLRGSQ